MIAPFTRTSHPFPSRDFRSCLEAVYAPWPRRVVVDRFGSEVALEVQERGATGTCAFDQPLLRWIDDHWRALNHL